MWRLLVLTSMCLYQNVIKLQLTIIFIHHYWRDIHSTRLLYRVAQKMAPFLYALTLPNINRFSKLFHCQNQAKICNNTITKDPIASQVCCYIILWNVKCLKGAATGLRPRPIVRIYCRHCTVHALPNPGRLAPIPRKRRKPTEADTKAACSSVSVRKKTANFRPATQWRRQIEALPICLNALPVALPVHLESHLLNTRWFCVDKLTDKAVWWSDFSCLNSAVMYSSLMLLPADQTLIQPMYNVVAT